MHPEAIRMRIDAWSAAPLHRNAAGLRERDGDPAQERRRPPVDLLFAWAVHDPQRCGQTAAERREREGDPERGQEWDEERRKVGHGSFACPQCR